MVVTLMNVAPWRTVPSLFKNKTRRNYLGLGFSLFTMPFYLESLNMIDTFKCGIKYSHQSSVHVCT
jgi:hypothetical protein